MYGKSAACMANNGKDAKYNRHISRRVNFVRNGEKWNMQNIYWCEVVLQLAYIAAKNVGENDLDPIMKYIILRLDNWNWTLLQEGWQYTG